jgi:hypothetical protein
MERKRKPDPTRELEALRQHVKEAKESNDALQQRVKASFDALRTRVNELEALERRVKDPYMAVWESLVGGRGLRLSDILRGGFPSPLYDEESVKPQTYRGLLLDGFPSPSQCSDSKWTGFSTNNHHASARGRGCIVSPVAAERLEQIRNGRPVYKFAERIGVSRKTYGRFIKTHSIRATSLETIAGRVGKPFEDLVQPDSETANAKNSTQTLPK